MAIGIVLSRHEDLSEEIAETAKLLFEAMPKGSSPEIHAAVAQARRTLDIMSKLISTRPT